MDFEGEGTQVGQYEYFTSGTPVDITAVPNAGYAFNQWIGGGGGTVNPKAVMA